MAVERIEDLDCWKLGRELTNEAYRVTRSEACRKDFGFVDQIRRASVSIMNNISEGFERDTNRDFIKFLFIAKGSAGEVRSMSYIALDQGYIEETEFDHMQELSCRCSAAIWGLIKSLGKRLDYRSKLAILTFLLLLPITKIWSQN